MCTYRRRIAFLWETMEGFIEEVLLSWALKPVQILKGRKKKRKRHCKQSKCYGISFKPICHGVVQKAQGGYIGVGRESE